MVIFLTATAADDDDGDATPNCCCCCCLPLCCCCCCDIIVIGNFLRFAAFFASFALDARIDSVRMLGSGGPSKGSQFFFKDFSYAVFHNLDGTPCLSSHSSSEAPAVMPRVLLIVFILFPLAPFHSSRFESIRVYSSPLDAVSQVSSVHLS